MLPPSAITIDIDPYLQVGPVSVAWHGLMIAIGIFVGGYPAARYARERGLSLNELLNVGIVMGIAGVIGARAFHIVETDLGALLRPAAWASAYGFAFNGALIAAAAGIGLYLRRKRLSPRYLDAVALGFPLGMAIGRIGDVINGEHHGPATDVAWALRHTHPDASVPSPVVAYHDGGLYELLIALAVFAVVWPLRHRFHRPLMALWTVIALYAVGRFLEFFYRSDSEDLALGLNGAQWTSLALMVIAAVGAWWTRDRPPLAADPPGRSTRPPSARAPDREAQIGG